MATPQGYGGQEQYDQSQGQQNHAQSQEQDNRPLGGRTKRRAYAGQAFDIGAGANANPNLGGQPPATAPYAAQSVGQQQYGGYQQQQQTQAQGYQQPAPVQQMAYGQQPGYGGYAPQPGGVPGAPQQYAPAGYSGGAGGYQPSAPQYPAQGGGVAAMTQQMAQMAMGGGTSSQAQPQNAPLQLNRLQAADLISHPFHVAELEQPPPPIILPPNVGIKTIVAVDKP